MPLIKRKSGEILQGDLKQIAERSIADREVLRAFFPVGLVVVREEGEEPGEGGEGGEIVATIDAPEGGKPGDPIPVVINTADIDRHDTIVDPTGADVNNFLRNPVLQYQHGCDHVVGDWVVGKVVLGEFTRDKIPASLLFDIEGKLHGDENKKIGLELDRMYRKGWLRAVSIGFIAKAYAIDNVDGREVLRYTEWELVELSCVAVPSNPMALSEAMRSVSTPALLEDLRTHATESDDKPQKLAPDVVVRSEFEALQRQLDERDIQLAERDAQIAELRRQLERMVSPTLEETEVEAVPVEWDLPYDLEAESRAAVNDANREAMVALVVRNGLDASYVMPHHHADGRLNWKAIAASMGRLLSTPIELTAEQADAVYEHLAEHYRELGIDVPEAGAKTADQAYDLALQGRMAHIDKAGYAWLFVEAVENGGVQHPGFVRCDDDAATLIGPQPATGRLTDHRAWGQRREVVVPRDERLLDELVRTQRQILEHTVRVGAKFSTATRNQITRWAEQVETAARAIGEGIGGLTEAATGLRAMVSTDVSDEAAGDGGSQKANDGGPKRSQVGPANGSPTRPIGPRRAA